MYVEQNPKKSENKTMTNIHGFVAKRTFSNRVNAQTRYFKHGTGFHQPEQALNKFLNWSSATEKHRTSLDSFWPFFPTFSQVFFLSKKTTTSTFFSLLK